jgi:flagellar motor switch protein FliN/FliY
MAGDTPPPDKTNTPEAEEPAAADPAAGRDAEAALDAAAKAADAIATETGPGHAATMPDLGGDPASGPAANGGQSAANLGLLGDVDLKVKIELGRTRMYVEDVLRLNASSVIELDKAAGDPVDIYVNDRHVARGEVLVVNENFCVRVSEIIHQPAPEG